MKKKEIPKAIISVWLTLLTTLFWIAFSVYRALVVKPSPTVPRDVSQKLNPTIDSVTLEKMQQAVYVDVSNLPSQTFTLEATISATPSPIPLPESIASPSASPIASPSASPESIEIQQS
ncbi:hypothetical protein ACFL1Q_02255 [Patescibacteria group bacterium]